MVALNQKSTVIIQVIVKFIMRERLISVSDVNSVQKRQLGLQNLVVSLMVALKSVDYQQQQNTFSEYM